MNIRQLEAFRAFMMAGSTKAAAELNVTHSAVSHQIKALEEWLGIALFRRINRGLVLTDSGQAYLKPVRESFLRLGDATRRLKADKRTAGIPVVALTGHALEGMSDGAKRAGCDAFVTKPCLPEDLVIEIRKVLGSNHRAAAKRTKSGTQPETSG